jgi:hypothetical protein
MGELLGLNEKIVLGELYMFLTLIKTLLKSGLLPYLVAVDKFKIAEFAVIHIQCSVLLLWSLLMSMVQEQH